MGARQKLNSASITGSLILAAFIGGFSGSWLVFIVATLIMLVLSLYSGDLRPGKKGR